MLRITLATLTGICVGILGTLTWFVALTLIEEDGEP